MVSASSLLLRASVRGLASCVSDGAVRVADVACAAPSATLISASASASASASVPASSTLSLTVTYRATPLSAPASPPLLLRLTWSHAPLGGPPALSFSPSPAAPAVLLRKLKGTRSIPATAAGGGGGAQLPALELFWDLTDARYGGYPASPEPVAGFYFVAVAVADAAEVVLAVGDLAADFVKAKFEGQIPTAPFHPVARRDCVVAPAPGRPRPHRYPAAAPAHTARVRFAEGAPEHEITVGCRAADSSTAGGGDEELWISVDGKRAVHARRLRWNFRGNHTVFVDGAPVDVMWDLHGWWRRDPHGCAVVMLRARSALESRLWLQEEEEAAAAPGFSLVVQAFRTPP